MIAWVWWCVCALFTFDYHNVYVNDTQTTYNKNIKDSEALVFTNVTTFKVDDTILFFRFDSHDFYGKIKKGCIYKVQAFGFRIPIFSMYPNIVDIEEISCEQKLSYNQKWVDEMIKTLKTTGDPEVRNDILNDLELIRRKDAKFEKHYDKIIKQYQLDWKVRV
jgi:hypothetical protein